MADPTQTTPRRENGLKAPLWGFKGHSHSHPQRRIMRVPAEEGQGRNNFQNRSGPGGDINAGPNSKFTPNQVEERLRVHAISVATGSPTLQQICDHLQERFGVSCTVPTEKSWRASNRERIDKKKMDLIEKGEIHIPVVSEQVLSDSMLNLTINTTRLSESLRKKANLVLQKITLEGSANDTEREKNEERLEVFKILTDSLAKMNKNIKDQIDSLFVFSSKIKIKDKEVQKIVDKHFDSKLKAINEADEEEDGEVEITDELRQKLIED